MTGIKHFTVVAFVFGGCALITDYGTPQPEGASSTSSAGASGGTGASSGTGAGGMGAGGACSADLETDSDHCGACAFSCDDEPCVDGACGQCIDLVAGGTILDRVTIEGEVLYFVHRVDNPGGAGGAGGQGGGGPGAYIRTLPLDFAGDSTPGLDYPIENGVTNMAVGTVGSHRVYIAGQVSTVIYACQPAGCLEFDIGDIVTQVNGMTAIGDKLYMVTQDGRLLRIPLDGQTGSPTGTPTTEVSTYTKPIVNAGVVELFHTLEPPRLYWGSWDIRQQGNGCVYRVDVAALPIPLRPGLSCYTDEYASAGFVVASDGTIYAQDGNTTIQKITGDPPTTTVFDSNAGFPRAVDEAYLYVRDVTSGGLRAIPRAGGPSVTSFTQPPGNLYGLDARHARYVVGTAGSHLCRWPKPQP